MVTSNKTNQKVNILLVDDHLENLLALEAVLTSPNYNLVKVYSGEEALKWVLKEEFAVILLDVQMPGINGFDTAKLIKEREKSKDIPIIFITAISQAVEHVTQGYSVGGIDYIFKPFEPAILIKKVENLVKIYKTIEKTKEQSELLRLKANELEEVNQELLDTTHEELKQSEERFRKTFESSPNLMAICSLIDTRYINVNECWEKHTGYSISEVKNRKLDLIKVAGNTPEQEANSYHLQKHPLRNLRVTYLTKSGKIRDGLLSTEILEIDGEKCLLSVITDITERLLLEQEMSRLDRLNLIGEMAAGIAHEIRNPMTTVRGFLQMMSARPQHAGSNEFFTLMIEELDRANSIITEFLSLSKNQSIELDKQNLNALVEALFPLIQADAFNSKKDARMELQAIPEFEFDEREIRQMILNLARNGLEAMSSGCTLTLRTYERSNEIFLEVQDQGSGIEPEILQRLGTPFFTTKEKGTGLGLAVCYGIAEKHKAKITIDTSPSGTTFIVRFPLYPFL